MTQTPPVTPIVSHDSDVPAAVADRLVAVVESAATGRNRHHATLAVTTGDGSRRWSAAVGTAGPDGAPLRPDTPFFIASITKRFIATLILQAHERGELHLDDRIVDHLAPEVVDGLHVRKGVDHTTAITVRHLLSHTSGLPDYWDRPRRGQSLYQQLAAGEDQAWTLADVVHLTREEHSPHFAPQDLSRSRQRARYSDTGFQLLIAILEQVTGRSFAALLTERILVPLGLEHTWLPGRSVPAAPTAAPSLVHAGERALDLPLMIVASNDLISTTGDLLRFQRGLTAGETFAAAATTDLLTERANLLSNMIPIRYGLGTMIFRVGRLSGPHHRPVTLVGHAGVTGTWLFRCPELDLHLAGSIDQAQGRSVPFRLMARVLRAWEA